MKEDAQYMAGETCDAELWQYFASLRDACGWANAILTHDGGFLDDDAQDALEAIDEEMRVAVRLIETVIAEQTFF